MPYQPPPKPGPDLHSELSSLLFAGVARRLGDVGREQGIPIPAFRSPPRVPGLRRSIRREADGTATVSVTLRGRPAMAVVSDMIEGMVAASDLTGPEAGRARDELWAAALTAFPAADERHQPAWGRYAA